MSKPDRFVANQNNPLQCVPFAYLSEQFANPEPILDEIRSLIATGDFTLGKALTEFEKRFAEFIGADHAIGVNCGTDAIRLSLMAANVGAGDEVITAANTFIATVGAINEVGARPILVDVDDSFCFDVGRVERAISSKTKAIVPVHLTGNMVDMPRLMDIADRHGIVVVEDACQAIGSRWNGKNAGNWGLTGTYSLHPLKFLNIWGDGGVITTNDETVAQKLRLLRNHGLADRDTVVTLGCNSRLDTLQAIVANRMLNDAEHIIERRNSNANAYDSGLAGVSQIRTPLRRTEVIHTFVTYQIFAEDRDGLLAYCRARGVDAKVHYPVPLYRQEGLRHFGYRKGDFPITDRQAETVLTLPVHQYVSPAQIDYVIATVREYYGVH